MTDVLILQPPSSAMAEQTARWSVIRAGAVIAEGVTGPGGGLERQERTRLVQGFALGPCAFSL